MITAEGKCDGKCGTCNIVQQSYCRLVQFRTEQDKLLVERLERIEQSIDAIEKRLGKEVITTQRGDGVEKVAENNI